MPVNNALRLIVRYLSCGHPSEPGEKTTQRRASERARQRGRLYKKPLTPGGLAPTPLIFIHSSMVQALEVTDYIKRQAAKLDEVSDEVDAVNVLKGKGAAMEYDDGSKFDAEKDKAAFRQYEDACDRVKNFYAVG